MRIALAACAVGLAAAGCSEGSHLAAISPDLPPAPSTWPAYPKFSSHSCWGRKDLSAKPMRSAPSSPVTSVARPVRPQVVARKLLARFGDRSLIRGVRIGRPTQGGHLYQPKNDPPPDGLWAYIDAPRSPAQGSKDPIELSKRSLSDWEVDLFYGALRDDFCRAGGRPLVGYSVSAQVAALASNAYALNQHFPNPSPSEFRARVGSVAKRYGFQPVSIRLLRPRELAPVVVVKPDRDRKEFISDVPKIVELLDPRAFSKQAVAETFEGIFFEARDDKGPFVRVDDVVRGTIMGGQWSAEPDAYPYPHG